MSGSLRDFLVELASNSELMTQFAADPAGVVDRAGLTADAKDAILSRDSDRLRVALGASAADHLTQVSIVKKRKGGKRKGAKKRPPVKTPVKKRRTGTKKR
jgi:hypothetical protein